MRAVEAPPAPPTMKLCEGVLPEFVRVLLDPVEREPLRWAPLPSRPEHIHQQALHEAWGETAAAGLLSPKLFEVPLDL